MHFAVYNVVLHQELQLELQLESLPIYLEAHLQVKWYKSKGYLKCQDNNSTMSH